MEDLKKIASAFPFYVYVIALGLVVGDLQVALGALRRDDPMEMILWLVVMGWVLLFLWVLAINRALMSDFEDSLDFAAHTGWNDAVDHIDDAIELHPDVRDIFMGANPYPNNHPDIESRAQS